MSECVDGNYYPSKEKPYTSNYWLIEDECGDVFEIWGEPTIESQELNEILKEKPYVVIHKKGGIFMRIINAIKEKDPPMAERTVIEIYGYKGSRPTLKIGKRLIYVRTIKKIQEWTGCSYPPFKRTPHRCP